MNGMAKVELYERFLHTLVVASARPAFSEFL
jgi:hypothetical protein